MHTMVCMLALVWITGCKQNNDQVLVKIGNKDSINVAELKEALKNKFGDENVSREEKKKLIMKMTENQLLLVAALDMNIVSDSSFQLSLARAKENIIKQAALEKYIYRYFINEKTISTYERNYNRTADVQNLIVAYRIDKNSKSQRSKESARALADSIFSKAILGNFNSLIEEFSDNIDPRTGKGNIVPQKMSIGTLPFVYEQTIFNSEPNTITPPIEIQGGFVIAKLNKFDTKVIVENLTRNRIAAIIKDKLEMSDSELLLAHYNTFVDSLRSNNNVMFHDATIDSFISTIRDDDKTSSLNERIADGKLVVSFGNDNGIDLKRFVNSFGAETKWADVNRNMIFNRLKQMVNDELLKDALRREGFAESEEFHFKVREWGRQFGSDVLRVKKMTDTTSVTIEVLRRYYEDNREQFSVQGSMKILEVYSAHFDALDSVAQLVDDKVDMVKAAEQVNGKKKDRIITIKEPANYPDTQNDELVKKALSLKPGEVSKIFQRKDGGYSMIRLMEKNEKKILPFDAVKNQVEHACRDVRQKKMLEKFLHELKLKYPVTVYEGHLK